MKIREYLKLFLFFYPLTTLYSQISPFFIDKNNYYSHFLFQNSNDTTSGTWSYISQIAEPLLGVNSVFIPEINRIFLAGGTDTSAIPKSNCYLYSPVTDSYSPAASLPSGRWSGKLVKVQNNLYLVGSIGNSFSSPDGLIFRYSVTSNTWNIHDTMPAPKVHEAAVCVIKDSLIMLIGGSSHSFSSPKKNVRLYNPVYDTWKSLTQYPINITTAHAESHRVNDSTFIVLVLGGYSAGYVNMMYKGILTLYSNDSVSLNWSDTENFPFAQGVYRVSGSKWNNYLLFGPAMRGAIAVNRIYGMKITGDSLAGWTCFLPPEPDSAGNIPTFSVITGSGSDSSYFYLFGGYRNYNATSAARRYAFKLSQPIGIIKEDGKLPSGFHLYQNFPNPFNPSTTISFSLPQDAYTELIVTDIMGRLVRKILKGYMKAGIYSVEFNASGLSSGIYFYSIIAGNFRDTRKMILIN